MKILVADDSKTNLALITSYLHKLGHIVIPANNGAQAIEEFNKSRPDLIILDVMMEKMDGFECARQIRTIDKEDWIPIIFLSANVDDVSISRGIDAGGDDYLTKPFSEITLAAKIKAMQRIADMRQKLIKMTIELARMSTTDSLTGIYNRFQFDRSIIEKTVVCNHHRCRLVLMFIDLDNFKTINDSFGHQVGDLLLKEVVIRIKACLTTDDFLARIGGDEFALILSHVENMDVIGKTAQQILDAIEQNYYIQNHDIRISASIGIASYPNTDTTHDTLVQNADVAMYHAKELGRNNYQFFNDELNNQYQMQINIGLALKFALERQEIHLTYQPIFELKSKKVIGIEASADWINPQLGAISPHVFIPIAEEIGIMGELGNFVIRTACEQAKQWKLDKIKDLRLSLNLSAYELMQENFYEMIVDTLKVNQIAPPFFQFELSEPVVMSKMNSVIEQTLKRLHALGIKICIDDFGAGYSSLARLKHLTIDSVKIDQCLIREAVSDPNSAIILNCLIALGHNLHLNIVGKGIENEEQYQLLKNSGCQYGQGIYLCQPLPSEKMTEFLLHL